MCSSLASYMTRSAEEQRKSQKDEFEYSLQDMKLNLTQVKGDIPEQWVWLIEIKVHINLSYWEHPKLILTTDNIKSIYDQWEQWNFLLVVVLHVINRNKSSFLFRY